MSASPRDGEALVLNVAGGARMCIPPSLEKTSAYILLEQEDWFEDEIRFLRRWLRPGMRAVDVGASFGTYTVAIARALGPGGRVWAFEPTPETADFLRRTLELNQAAHATLAAKAVTDHGGEVSFVVNPNSEFNAIADGPAVAERVTVPCTTLDESAAAQAWGSIDFLKLDVEGAEIEAVAGGSELLSAATPLVMFEIKAGNVWDLGVLEPLAGLGYEFYRLLPGAMLLVPFDPQQPTDEYLLNLFACKPDRARELAAEGLLADAREARQAKTEPDAWNAFAHKAPYARVLAGHWPAKAGFFAGGGARPYFAGLAAFAESLLQGQEPAARLRLLTRAFELVADSLQARRSLARTLSYARLAFELGARRLAMDTLDEAMGRVGAEGAQVLAEPFLAPDPRFEGLPAPAAPNDWLTCAVIEPLEKLRAYSSWWTGMSALDLLAPIAQNPLRAPEMERRRQLVRIRNGLQRGPEAVPLLTERSALNLNPEFWSGGGAQLLSDSAQR